MKKLVLPILVLLATSLYGQSDETAPKAPATASSASLKAIEAERWRRRADEIAAIAEKDAMSLDGGGQRAFYLAVLAKTMRGLNTEETRRLARASAKAALASLDDDNASPDAVAEQFAGAGKAIAILTEIDPEIGATTARAFAEKVREVAAGRTRNADLLVEIGLVLVAKDPLAAYRAGVSSMQYGVPTQLFRLIGELNLKDPKLAAQLLDLAVADPMLGRNPVFASRIAYIATTSYKGSTFPDAVKRRVLGRLADLLSRALADRRDAPNACGIAGPVIDRLELYQTLLPERFPTVREYARICATFFPGGPTSDEIDQRDAPKTADELVRAARNTLDPVRKATLFRLALEAFERDEKLERAVALLDDMTEDERKAVSMGFWESWRGEYATRLARSYLQADDRPAFYRVLEKAPSNVRQSIYLGVLFKLDFGKDEQLATELADSCFGETRRLVGMPAVDRAGIYESLARIFVRLRATDAHEAFTLMIKALNEVDSANEKHRFEKEYSPLDIAIRIPAELLEVDESGTLSTVRSVSWTRTRVRVGIGLLQNVLVKIPPAPSAPLP